MMDGWLSKTEKEKTGQTRSTHVTVLLIGDAPYLVPGQSLEKSAIFFSFSSDKDRSPVPGAAAQCFFSSDLSVSSSVGDERGENFIVNFSVSICFSWPNPACRESQAWQVDSTTASVSSLPKNVGLRLSSLK